MTDYITPSQFHEAEGTGDWRVLGDGATSIIRTGSLTEAARLVQAISALPAVDAHPPDIDIRPEGVTLRLLTREGHFYGMSQRDVALARELSRVVGEFGLRCDPQAAQTVLVVPGATNRAAIMPFWQAALGYERRPDSPDEDLVDAQRRGPGLWFEQMDEPRSDGGGNVHVVVYVPPEQAEARIAAGLAAGGRMVRDAYAPSWWTLADPAGNEVDISTTQGRA